MCCGLLKGFGGLGAIVALILVVVALETTDSARWVPAYGAEGCDCCRVHRSARDDRARDLA